jgi:hypothetical protein
MNIVRNYIIDKYVVLIYEYLHIMSTSEILNNLEQFPSILQIGISSITHIYKIAFLLSRNVATSACHCQKGMYCYLEYIEQMHKANMLHTLDNVDAVAFIYEKTISEIYGVSGSTPFSNIISISEMNRAQENDMIRCTKALDLLAKLIHVVLWLDNPIIHCNDRMEMVETRLHLICTLFVEYSLDPLLVWIESIQSKLAPFSKQEYFEFIDSLTKHIKRSIKSQQVPTKTAINDACLFIHAYYCDKPMGQIAEEEGWKKPMDDLMKLVFSN